jgi:hypothetical protein
MARYTYLEIVRSIVEDLNGLDNPETIYTLDQTLQSTMVKRIVKETYFQIISGRDWAHLWEALQLTETSGSTPTHMTIPDNAMEIEYIKYNIRKSTDTKDRFIDMKRMEPHDFMRMVDSRDSSASDIDVITDPSGIFINVYNDRAPVYWTSFNDSTIIFDGYDSAVDATNLVAAKTQCRAQLYPTVTESDTFVFDMPSQMFNLLLAECKSVAYVVLNRQSNPKFEQISNTQRRRLSVEEHKVNQEINYPNYGRRGKK